MAIQNCWEFKRCGREPGGPRAKDLGVCQAAIEARAAGANRGRNGGRACWAIAGTLCGGKVQGSFVAKAASCLQCDFYGLVVQEEGSSLANTRDILSRVR